MVLCDLLLSFTVFSRFIHVVACVRTPFLFRAESYSTAWTHSVVFIRHSVDGYWLFPSSSSCECCCNKHRRAWTWLRPPPCRLLWVYLLISDRQLSPLLGSWWPLIIIWDQCCHEHLCTSFWVHMLSFLLAVHLSVPLLGHVVTLYLTLWGPARQFARGAALFYVSKGNIWIFQFLCISIFTIIYLFDYSYPNGWRAAFHCGFVWYFLGG